MKILQVCPRYSPYIGGVEAHVQEISERLAERGHAVEVISCDPSSRMLKEELINGVKIKRFKSWAPNESYFFSSSLKKYLERNSSCYDVVHAHSYHAFPALYVSQANTGKKTVFTPHYVGGGGTVFRNLLHLPYKYIGKKIFVNSNKIICVSKYEREMLKDVFGLGDQKLVFVPNGVNVLEIKRLKGNVRKQPVVLCVSRLEKYKGIQYVVGALRELDGVNLEIVGTGPFKKNLTRLVNQLGLGARVSFFENLPRRELIEKYCAARVFCLLSERECYGITVAEALCAGTACVVAKTTALTEWVDNTNCLGIDYADRARGLAALIRRAMGIEVYDVPLPDWDSVVDRIERIYTSI